MGNERSDESKEIIDLVVARLNAMPSDAELSVGSEGTFSIEKLIENVQENTELGQEIIKLQLDYLRSLKDLPLNLV